jgi:hypothetical protein
MNKQLNEEVVVIQERIQELGENVYSQCFSLKKRLEDCQRIDAK